MLAINLDSRLGTQSLGLGAKLVPGENWQQSEDMQSSTVKGFRILDLVVFIYLF